MIEKIEEQIKRLEREQAITAAAFDQLSAQLRQTQTRYAQLSGGIEQLRNLKTSLNGAPQ